jgi:hypothetical protein
MSDGNTSVTIVKLGRRRALAAHVGHADVPTDPGRTVGDSGTVAKSRS